MYSRAHLLIERDYEMLIKDQLWGIDACQLKEDNYFEWVAKICGMKGTLWEGGVFRLYLRFDEYYNKKPPEVCFHTIPFHPNVDMITGKPCVSFLDDPSEWQESYSMSYILLSIQNLLANPVLSEAVNTDAVNMIASSPHSYKQMVLDCVAASKRVEAGLSPHFEDDKKIRFAPPKDNVQKPATPKTSTVKVSKLSFDDYLKTWSGIATSKTAPNTKNPLLESIKDTPALQAAHYGVPPEELKNQADRQAEEQNGLVYGRFKSKPTEEELRQAKIDQVNRMRKIYLQPRNTPPPTPGQQWRGLTDEDLMLNRGVTGPEEPWEQEVDDLVAWSTKLDEDSVQ